MFSCEIFRGWMIAGKAGTVNPEARLGSGPKAQKQSLPLKNKGLRHLFRLPASTSRPFFRNYFAIG
jgi:hypothetical protein